MNAEHGAEDGWLHAPLAERQWGYRHFLVTEILTATIRIRLLWASLAKPSVYQWGVSPAHRRARHTGLPRRCRHALPQRSPLVMPTAWLGEPMVAVLRREPPRVRPQRGLRLRRSKAAIVGHLTSIHAI